MASLWKRWTSTASLGISNTYPPALAKRTGLDSWPSCTSQRLPYRGDVHLQGVGRRGWGHFAPQDVHQPSGGHDPSGFKRQHSEHRLRLDPDQANRRTLPQHRHRSKESNIPLLHVNIEPVANRGGKEPLLSEARFDVGEISACASEHPQRSRAAFGSVDRERRCVTIRRRRSVAPANPRHCLRLPEGHQARCFRTSSASLKP